MRDVELKFSNLTHDEAQYLLSAHARLVEARGEDADQPFRHVEQAHGGVPAEIQEDVQWGNPAAGQTVQPFHNPVLTQPEPAAPVTGVAVDKAGIAWREDTHSGSRKLNANGTWTIRKNCPAALSEAYKAEFARRIAAGAPPSPAQLNQQFGAPPVFQPQPAPNAAPVLTGFGNPAPEITWEQFGGLYMSLRDRLAQVPEWLPTMCSQVGVPDIHALEAQPAARAAAYSMLKQFELR